LKAQVKDEPVLLLKSIAATYANYIEAEKLLNERYQHKRDLLNATLKRLFALQPLKGESATAMRRFVDTAVECVRCLEVIERPVDQWGDIPVYIITSKLKPESF
jgi:hypothetical protein